VTAFKLHKAKTFSWFQLYPTAASLMKAERCKVYLIDKERWIWWFHFWGSNCNTNDTKL